MDIKAAPPGRSPDQTPLASAREPGPPARGVIPLEDLPEAACEDALRAELDALFDWEPGVRVLLEPGAAAGFEDDGPDGRPLIDVRDSGLVTVVTVRSPSLRERQASRLFADLRSLVASQPVRTRYAISLGLVEHLGVTIVPRLLEMQDWFRRNGRQMVLFDCPRDWRRMLRSAHLDRQIALAKDLRAAERMLR